MTVTDLIWALKEACNYSDEDMDEVEVRIAWPQFHPLQAKIDSGPDITVLEIESDTDVEPYATSKKIIYLPAEPAYHLPGEAEVVLGWKEG